MRTACSVLFFLFSQLHGSISDYFKEIPEGFSSSSISPVDHIYLINLDFRQDRFNRCIEQFSKYDIIPQRFSAVYGQDLLDKGFCDMRSNGMKPGAIGCMISHLSVIHDAYNKNYETIWLLEDDFDIKEDPNSLNGLIKELDRAVGKANWDILYTDRMGPAEPKAGNRRSVPPSNNSGVSEKELAIRQWINKDFIRIGFRARAHSMIIKRSGMKKILDHFENESLTRFHPYDIELGFVPGLKQYMLSFPVVTWNRDSHAHSNIQHGEHVHFNRKQ